MLLLLTEQAPFGATIVNRTGFIWCNEVVIVNNEPIIPENDSQQISSPPKIEKHVCLDLRMLNRHIKCLHFPFPCVQDIAHEQPTVYYTLLDL